MPIWGEASNESTFNQRTRYPAWLAAGRARGDLQVDQGETVALIGANGAGKTTLLRAIAGAHRASRGQIHLDGLDVTRMPPYQRVAMGIALVPEGRRLFAAMTVEENLQLARASGRRGDWTVDRVMDTFPMLKARRKARCGDAFRRRAASDRDRTRVDDQPARAAAR